MKPSSEQTYISIFLVQAFLIIAQPGVSQNVLRGKVVDEKSKQAIPFVNISIPGTFHGTVTNKDGNFSLKAPSSFSDIILVFSYIGYQSDSILLSRFNPEQTVQLKKKINQLNEVLVIGPNTVYELLKNAFDKIPENYPENSTYYKGFYRETAKNEDGQYISYGEALLESVRGPINLKNDIGQIRILKSRGGNLLGKAKTTNINFYGGLFLATTDFVQKRSDFINPAHFNKFNYSVQKEGHVLKINFKSKGKKNKLEGYFLLDTLSLAYTEAKFTQERNANKIIYQKLDTDRFFKFVSINQKYYLKYSNFNSAGIDKVKKKKIHHFNEYLATEIMPDSNKKIPEKERIKYFDVFINEVEEYTTDCWDGFSIMETDSLLRNTKLTYKEQYAIKEQRKKTERRKKMIKVISNLSLEYGVSNSFSFVEPGNYSYLLSSPIQKSNSNIASHNIWGYNAAMGYFFLPDLALVYSEQGNFSSSNKYRDYTLGLKFKKQLNAFGRPTFIALSTALGKANTSKKIGTFQHQESFRWGNKTFTSGRFDVFAGRQAFLMKPTVGIYCHLKGKSSVFMAISYLHEISSKENISIKERSGLFKQSADEAINSSPRVRIYKNGRRISETGLTTPTFSVTLGINFLR